MKLVSAALLLAGVVIDASAAGPIYRCGRDYSQTPCANGTVLDVGDPRSAAQRAEAKRVAAQERKQAAMLQRERLAQAARATPASASGFNGRPPPPSASAASAGHPAKARKKRAHRQPAPAPDFVAVVPGPAPKATPK